MTFVYNDLNQPVGLPVPNWTPPPVPPPKVIEGRYCRLEPLEPARHAAALWEAFSLDKDGRDWTYLPHGPFPSLAEFRLWLEAAHQAAETPLSGGRCILFAIVVQPAEKPLGMASYCSIAPPRGSIEVSGIHYANPLKKTRPATEAMYLMMRNVFELGYRRYEWKCDALNAASRAAAQRLGFSYEGTFRQALVYKGRNRDTTWYSVIDSEWPPLREVFEQWLDPANFNEQGRQIRLLSDMTAPLLKQIG